MLHNSLGLLFLFSTYALNTVEASPSVVTSTACSYSPGWSPSQLSEIPNAKFLIVPGTSLDTNTTIIPDRYECSHIKGAFAIDGADDKKLLLTLSTTWPLGSSPKCDLSWGDGSNEEVAFNSTTMLALNWTPMLTISHTYADFSSYAVELNCSNESGNVCNCPAQNDSCVESPEFFDAIFKDINTPLKCFVNDRNQFDSYLNVNEFCSSQSPVINWRLNKIKGSSIEPFTNFTQPNSSVLAFDPYDIEPGLYVLSLELTFKHFNASSWNADYMLVYVMLPELVATISGGTILTIPHGTTFNVDASRSNDPAARLESISGEQIIANWSFVNYAAGPSEIKRNVFTKLFPTRGLPTGSKIYVIQTGDEYLLSVNSSYFPVNSWCLVMFSIKRGDRASSVIQWLNLVSNAVPITISCIKNCHAGREKKILDEEIQFDAVIPQDLEGVTGVTYSWTILNLNLVNKFVEAKVAPELIPTGRTSRYVGIAKGALTPGQHYTIKVQVTVPGYAAGSASIVGTVNYVPYAGTCTLDRDSGVGATDLFAFSCSGWKGADDRIIKNATADVNPLLSISVLQKITSFSGLEPILLKNTRSRKSYFAVSSGWKYEDYQTRIYIRVTDIYKNYEEIQFLIRALPPSASQGADIVTDNLNESGDITNMDLMDALAQLTKQLNTTA